MPYSCALAVCATFCSHIAPALIPIFGPSFPSQCVVSDAPEHGRMIIDPNIIHAATAEAESYRLQYTSFTPKSSTSVTPRDSASPQQQSSKYLVRTNAMTPPTSSSSHLERRLRLKRAYGGDSPYAESSTDHDAVSEASSGDAAYFCSPVTPNSGLAVTNWGVHTRSHLPNGPSHSLSAAMDHHQHQNMNSHAANSGINISSMGMGMGVHAHGHTHNHKMVNGSMVIGPTGTNPWLSAIPRSIGGLADMTAGWRAKRSAEELEEAASSERTRERELNRPLHPADEEYDGGEESASATGDERSPGGAGNDDEDKALRCGLPLSFTPEASSISTQHPHPHQHQSPTQTQKQINTETPTNNFKVPGAGDATAMTMAAGDEKKAAWLLMKLSVKDGEAGSALHSPGFGLPLPGTGLQLPPILPVVPSMSVVGTPLMGSARWCRDEGLGGYGDSDGPRVKRRRALSM